MIKILPILFILANLAYSGVTLHNEFANKISSDEREQVETVTNQLLEQCRDYMPLIEDPNHECVVKYNEIKASL